MKDIFIYLCNFSIVTSVAILLAVVLRPVLKKGPSFIRCILWALVFLRLLVPVGLVEVLPPVSLFDGAEEAVSTPQEEGTPAGNAVPDGNVVQDPVQSPTLPLPEVQPPIVHLPASDAIPDQGETVSTPVTDQDVPQGDQPPQAEHEPQPELLPQPKTEADILFVLSVVWAAGAVAMLGYMLASNLLLRYRVRSAIVYDSRIRVIDRDCSPFVFGIFRPIIYIPASVNKADWSYIIAHETSHIKRFDHVLKPLAFFVLCFYWCNPLVWTAYILLSKDIEYACDERTVKSMEGSDRKAYSLALLAVSQGENIVFAPPLSFGKVSVKERIKRVMTRKIPVWAMCLTIIICASLLVLAALTPSSGERVDAEGAETSSEESEPLAALEISVSFADAPDVMDRSQFFDEKGYELLEIKVNREVSDFRFIKVLYDEDGAPYAGDALFTAETLTSEIPFYALTHINEGMSDRGISFVDDDGQTVFYRIMYDSYGGEGSGDSLYLERIAERPSDAIPSDSILYEPNASLPAYTVTVEYTDADKRIADQLVVTERESGREVQRIVLSENERFTDEPAYVIDLTFDGYADLILPNQKPSGAVWYHAFVWDAQEGALVYAPGFSELSNATLDTGRKQILSYRVSSMVSTYAISVFDAEKQDFVTLHSLYWDWSDGEETVFREFNEKNEVVKEFTFSGTVLDPHNPDAKLYFEEGSVWELTSAKWGAGALTVESGGSEDLPLPDFSSMALLEFFPEGNKYFDAGANAFRVIDSYVRGDLDRIKTRYALDGSVILPEQAPRNTIADYSDYCITQVSADSYALDGKQVEKITIVASLYCVKEGQEGYLDFRLELVNAPYAYDWKLLRLDVKNGSKPTGDDTIPLTDPMTVQDFLSSAKCQELQITAFNFINAYFGGDYEGARQMFIAPSWALDDPDAWNSRSRDDYSSYGISWVSFEPYELDGEQVQKARFYLSMFRAVPGEEGVYDPLLEFVYVDHQWRILSLDFGA